MNLAPWDRHATEYEQCELLAALIRCQKPTLVVESGTHKGYGAQYMARALLQNGDGRLHTADPKDHGVAKALADLPLTYYKMGFLEMLAQIDDEIDFAYIDGSEDGPEGAKIRMQHFDAVMERLSPGGIICVDDTSPASKWSDGADGMTAVYIRGICQVNFRFLRGLSIYVDPR